MHSRVVTKHRVASDHLPVAVKLRVTSQGPDVLGPGG
jgi:endonuclease/exonuclease/phosphatase family metal-dependent hydrolase